MSTTLRERFEQVRDPEICCAALFYVHHDDNHYRACPHCSTRRHGER